MIKNLALAAVAVGLMASPSSASIVIDDFSVAGDSNSAAPNTPIANGVLRTLSDSDGAANDTVISVSSGIGFAGTIAEGGTVSVSYDLTGSSINRGFFVDRVLQVGLDFTPFIPFGFVPDFDLTLAVTSSVGAPVSVTLAGLATIPSAIDLLDLESNFGGGNLAAFASVDTISISVTNNSFQPTTAGVSITQSGPIGITAVPEPTSIALLGLTGVGGVIAVRRRRKSDSAA